MKKVFVFGIFFLMLFFCSCTIKQEQKMVKQIEKQIGYLGSNQLEVVIYSIHNKEEKKVYRGTKIEFYEGKIKNKADGKEYIKIRMGKQDYLVESRYVVKNYQDVIFETDKYVRTSTTVYKNKSGHEILGLVKKSELIKIIGFDQLKNGVALKYKIVYNDNEGFVYSKYLVDTKEEAERHYDQENTYQIHVERKNVLGGGDAGSLDFYPYKKANFENNKMPEEVRSFYLNASVLKDIDLYIELAKSSNINAFVVDIKDNTLPGYASEVMRQYSKTNYDHAINHFEEYKSAIQKLKDHGFYVIGRITVFKDSYYVMDHPEVAICDKSNQPYQHNGSFWPSGYHRQVWEFNVALAKEAVQKMGFHEIQFDYVRFPDRTYSLEKNGIIDLKNQYNETKAQAIQTFLMYACDQLHELEVYVSADVFGESAHHYVTGYGQYWGAISNIVDVISAMPYPDHFGAYEYGIEEIVWTVPYKVLYKWASGYALKRQQEIPTPAKVRTWIQAYDTVRQPYVIYDSPKIIEQISALKNAGLTDGYMTWNASSSLSKYQEIRQAFKKEY